MKKILIALVVLVFSLLTFSTITLAKEISNVPTGVVAQTIFVGIFYNEGSSYYVVQYPCTTPGDPYSCVSYCEVKERWTSGFHIRNRDHNKSIKVTYIKMYDADGDIVLEFDWMIDYFFDIPLTLSPGQSMSQKISPSAFSIAAEGDPSKILELYDQATGGEYKGKPHLIVEWESVDGDPVIPPEVSACIVGWKTAGWTSPPGCCCADGYGEGFGPRTFTYSLSFGVVIEERTK